MALILSMSMTIDIEPQKALPFRSLLTKSGLIGSALFYTKLIETSANVPKNIPIQITLTRVNIAFINFEPFFQRTIFSSTITGLAA